MLRLPDGGGKGNGAPLPSATGPNRASTCPHATRPGLLCARNPTGMWPGRAARMWAALRRCDVHPTPRASDVLARPAPQSPRSPHPDAQDSVPSSDRRRRAARSPRAPPRAPREAAPTETASAHLRPGHARQLRHRGRRSTRRAEAVVTIKSTDHRDAARARPRDRIVGTAFPDGPVPDELQAAPPPRSPSLSDKVPGQEALLALEPDLVYAGWESNFSAEGAGDRATLAEPRRRARTSPPAACKEAGYMPDPLTFDEVFARDRRGRRDLRRPEPRPSSSRSSRPTLDAIEPDAAG